MPNLEHPDITRTLRTGYPTPEPKLVGKDFFGHEFYEGETLLVFGDEVFLKEELSHDAIEILEYYGANETTAKK